MAFYSMLGKEASNDWNLKYCAPTVTQTMVRLPGLSHTQVNKYMHAKIQTVSGIRGEIKKAHLCLLHAEG